MNGPTPTGAGDAISSNVNVSGYLNSAILGCPTLDSTLIVEFNNGNSNGQEGNSGITGVTNLTLAVKGGISTSPRRVDLLLTDGTATLADNDYSQTNATITIPAGNYTGAVAITIPVAALGIVGDTVIEPNETLTVTLQNPSTGLIFGDSNGLNGIVTTANFTILNDDATLTPTSTNTATSTSTATATSTSTATLTFTNTATATFTETPTSTFTSTATETSTLTSTATETATTTETSTATVIAATSTETATETSVFTTNTPMTTSTVTSTGTASTQTPTSTTGADAPTPAIVVIDPAITKLGDPSLALPGETVTFTMTATNVVVQDQIPSAVFQVVSATTQQGTYQINGNTVLFFIGTLNPNQVVVMTIVTRVSEDVVPPVDVNNTVLLTYNEGPDRLISASANIRIVREIKLPATGVRSAETGANNALPLIAGALIAGIVIAAVIWRRRTA